MYERFLSFSSQVNIEERESRQLPLYLLLKNIDLNLTGFSTVAFEAALFNVPTVFFHKNAKDGFKGQIDRSLFFYAENHEDMLESIHTIFSKDTGGCTKSTYIDTDPQTHISCIKKMINTAQHVRGMG